MTVNENGEDTSKSGRADLGLSSDEKEPIIKVQECQHPYTTVLKIALSSSLLALSLKIFYVFVIYSPFV